MNDRLAGLCALGLLLASLLLLLLPREIGSTAALPEGSAGLPRGGASPAVSAPEAATLDGLFSPSPNPSPSRSPAQNVRLSRQTTSDPEQRSDLPNSRPQVGRILLSGGRETIFVRRR